MEPRSQRRFLQILTPLLAVGAAVALTHWVELLRNRASLFLYLAAVICSARLRGWVSGLLATALSIVAIYFLNPIHPAAEDLFGLAVFTVVSLMILSLHAARGTAEMALRASQQRLTLCLDAAHMGIWDYNLLSRKFWWSPSLETLYGRTSSEFPNTYGRFFGFIHFDDQPLFNRAITRTIDEGTDYEVDHRIVLPDESIRWVNTRGRVFFNQNSRAERIVGIVTDITNKKKIERQQELSREASGETRLTTVA